MFAPDFSDSYFTFADTSEGLVKDRNSKFYYYGFSVSTEQDVQTYLTRLRKKHPKANHHCFAYCLGKGGAIFRASDDGEPGHTAGDPILGQIRSFDLSNVLLVVVRYFGGTKLGKSGLIQAYRTAARLAIEENLIHETYWTNTAVLQFDYPQMEEVMRLIKQENLAIHAQQMDLRCTIQLVVRIGLKDQLTEAFTSISGLQISWRE